MSVWAFIFSLLKALLFRLIPWPSTTSAKEEEPPAITAKRRELIDTIARNSRVLEVAAGNAANLLAGAYEGSAGRFATLTFAETDPVKRANLQQNLPQRAPGVSAGELHLSDAQLPSLPFQDQSFDAVVLFFVASRIDERSPAIAELVRVLAPNGQLLFMDHGIYPATSEGDASRRGDNIDKEQSSNNQSAVNWRQGLRRLSRQPRERSLDLVMEEIRGEELLEEKFATRMPVHCAFKEIIYACFVRKPDRDT